MKLIRLGDYIEQVDVRNRENEFKSNSVMGISVNKILIPTKAKIKNVELKNYKILLKGQFTYCLVTSRNGNKISIVYNDLKDCLVSSINPVFKIKDSAKEILDPYYLFMFFMRPEFDRFARFNSWGSAREVFSWEDFSDIKIPLPNLKIQKKYVDIYKSMKKNQYCFEKKLDELKSVFDIYYDKIKRENLTPLGEIVYVNNKKNAKHEFNSKHLKGLSDKNVFASTTALVKEEDLDKYLIVSPSEIAVNFMCLGNFGKFYIAYNDSDMSYLVSPACTALAIKNNVKIDPYYLLATLQRSEFQRRCVFCGAGNTRGGINYDDFSALSIPLIDYEKQKALASIYKIYGERRKIGEKLRRENGNLCSILISGSIKEAEEYE